MQDKLDSADAALAQRPPAVEKARTLLEEGQKLTAIRQKKIKIADRSENGWATVEEYEEGELTANSYNEKRLFGAEARAGSIKKQKQYSKNTNPRKRGQPPGGATKSGLLLPATSIGGASDELAQAAVLLQNLVAPVRQSSTGSGTSQLGPCYMCGKLGHFSRVFKELLNC